MGYFSTSIQVVVAWSAENPMPDWIFFSGIFGIPLLAAAVALPVSLRARTPSTGFRLCMVLTTLLALLVGGGVGIVVDIGSPTRGQFSAAGALCCAQTFAGPLVGALAGSVSWGLLAKRGKNR